MHRVYSDAAALPSAWDDAAHNNPYLTRDRLSVLQRTNPCGQQYVLFSAGAATADSMLVTYRLPIDVLSFSKLRLRLPLTVVGVPCSVSKPGFIFGERTKAEALGYLQSIPGMVLVLNADQIISLPQFARGMTLPTCRLKVVHSSFEDYLGAMRSHYRYRCQQALKKGSFLQVKRLADNSTLGPQLYRLYQQVYQASDYKLEQLDIAFFQQMDAEIYVFSAAGTPVGFVQLLQHQRELNFLFGGLDYAQNKQFDTYINLLLFIVKQAIARDCLLVDFGQTAEDAKAKLGCQMQPRYMYVRHQNPIIHLVINKLLPHFDYRLPDCHFRVFKTPEGDRP